MKLKKYKLIQSGGKYNLDFDIDNLFQGYSGFGIDGTDKNKFSQNSYPETYGEITKQGLDQIFSKFDTKDKIFYDLGSGIGKAVIYSVLQYGIKLGVGIELSTKRHKQAMQIWQTIPNNSKNKVILHNGDILDKKYNLSDADFIFISNLCMDYELNKKIENKLENEVEEGTIIFCSQALNSPRLKLIEKIYVSMTWNKNSSVRIYKFI